MLLLGLLLVVVPTRGFVSRAELALPFIVLRITTPPHASAGLLLPDMARLAPRSIVFLGRQRLLATGRRCTAARACCSGAAAGRGQARSWAAAAARPSQCLDVA
ncbi:unnamed protein product [Prorocentrum cordatum]|uniref:Secreted protein n=1 Tax=Prorocentrum cordatum TaxID=2364126 RepID=A0ABN9UVC9_9DINO|nr:unnamed protein product [Polarella glacialis]